jgi:hypothetical protein
MTEEEAGLFVSLQLSASVENTGDDNLIATYFERDTYPAFETNNPQTGLQFVADCSALGEEAETLDEPANAGTNASFKPPRRSLP